MNWMKNPKWHRKRQLVAHEREEKRKELHPRKDALVKKRRPVRRLPWEVYVAHMQEAYRGKNQMR